MFNEQNRFGNRIHCFYRTALNNNEKFRSCKSKENIHKKLGHTAVSAIKASSVTLQTWQKEPVVNTVNLQFLTWQLFQPATASEESVSR